MAPGAGVVLSIMNVSASGSSSKEIFFAFPRGSHTSIKPTCESALVKRLTEATLRVSPDSITRATTTNS